ncbi:hypothetical protein GUITHDRAFT_104262 [Guillardia theta CCMP2712]|uniref:Uncharacterized protein n=1 Tax=Guillardia theta (strain CCMP2712) TaxID=905079 RepID=L1JN57_GUITC|nr:hypothetical protein GUITHDRAFT_104262 [Guillardia theta CCMP2712]EKX49867.1 hypothetical protein GUITHDRAFT_104262 [Guillardia theta CCMP2712]|eukprot:XP_005836847.1 hypothetical protein GUITHDRAFT_104262 [Guillardia theta CCMP2712]
MNAERRGSTKEFPYFRPTFSPQFRPAKGFFYDHASPVSERAHRDRFVTGGTRPRTGRSPDGREKEPRSTVEDQASNVLHLVLENKISDDRFLTFACAASGELDEALWREALKIMRHRHVEPRDSHRTDSIHHRQRKAVIKHIIRPRLGASEALDEACDAVAFDLESPLRATSIVGSP